MAHYQFTQTQKIPADIDAVWKFISNPNNLKHITPDYMGFDVTSNNGTETMYAGMIITYKVSPVAGIPLNWITEITHVKERVFFVDEQRKGPYSFWHHQHRIEPITGGTLMTDIVTYIPPLGLLGAIANKLFIASKLREIFRFRTSALEKTFGTFSDLR